MSSHWILTTKRVTVLLVITASFLRPSSAASRDGWTRTGPEGGSITALAIDPHTPRTLYAGTLIGGAYKSIDGGESWYQINSGLADVSVRRRSPSAPAIENALGRLHITVLAVDPVTPATVYAGTWSGEVFKSTDGRGTWSPVYIGQMIQFVRSLVIDPKTPEILYVSGWPVNWRPGLPSPGLRIYVGGGVLKSTDGGKNWRPVNVGLPQSFRDPSPSSPIMPLGAADLAIDSQTPSTLYAATEVGMFKTVDGGETWQTANAGLAELNLTAAAVDPQTPTTIYAAASGSRGPSNPRRFPKIFKSVDGAGSWKMVSHVGETTPGPDLRILAVDPHRPTTLFAAAGPPATGPRGGGPHEPGGSGRGGLFKSIDGGSSWRSISVDVTNRGIRALAIDPARPETIYAGIEVGGVWKSTDGGERWHDVNYGLTGLDLVPLALAIDLNAPATVYTGTSGGGIFKSIDRGGIWRPINTGLVNPNIDVLVVDPRVSTTIYAGTRRGEVFRSTDGGGRWHLRNAGLGVGTDFAVNTLLIDPRTPTTVYLSRIHSTYGAPSGVYKSLDSGSTWHSINAGLPDGMITGLAIAPSAPETLYLSLRRVGISALSGGVYKTTDGGKMWTRAGETTPIGGLLAVDPGTPDVVYASDTYIEGSGIFKSTDGGRRWRPINTGLTNLHVNAIAINPLTPTAVYVSAGEWQEGAPGGVFESTDGGNRWHALTNGLTDLYVLALAIDPRVPSTLYAATRDGIFVLLR